MHAWATLKERFKKSLYLVAVDHFINQHVTAAFGQRIRRMIPHKIKQVIKFFIVLILYAITQFSRHKPSFKTAWDTFSHSTQRLKLIAYYSLKIPPGNVGVNQLVSIIILNRNGVHHLQRLFASILNHTAYPNFELILVDNASSDNSVELVKQWQDKLPIELICNNENESFSKANNRSVKAAKGDLLVFLNNDTDPLKNWLCHLVACWRRHQDAGAIGCKLIYPYKFGFENSFKIQHAGLHFKRETGLIRPYNSGVGLDHNTPSISQTGEKAAVTAAAMLVDRQRFEEVGGFDESYIYGYEDVDVCLKLHDQGYKNYYCAEAVLFHYEFGTQEKDERTEVRNRRWNNIIVFRKRWYEFLQQKFLHEKFNSQPDLFFEKGLDITFIVTEKGSSARAGDYYTALELGIALEKQGCKIHFLTMRGGDCYQILESTEVIIVMCDSFEWGKVKGNKRAYKIAWMRNWFERWITNPDFYAYDIILASSKKACRFVEEKTNKKTIYFPIATNPQRFMHAAHNHQFDSDYCFTGSYWHSERDIMHLLEPEQLPYTFKVFGENWQSFPKFNAYHQGFLNYEQMPSVYASTKLVIDDANVVTKAWGSVNSRVYDALGAGKLVLTNGVEGSKDVFLGLLPTFRTQADLHEQIGYYLQNDSEREALVEKLRKIVYESHTYQHRAQELFDILKDHQPIPKIAIKIPAPGWHVVHEWGDYHFAKALKKYFERSGNLQVTLQVLPEWEDLQGLDHDVVIVLRGLSYYKPLAGQLNIMWLISHPEKIDKDEMRLYDLVYVASIKYEAELRKALPNTKVLLQCTDHEVFKPYEYNDCQSEVLFVGNSRLIYRKSLKYLIPKNLFNIDVYGTRWEKIIPKEYIKGEHISNDELHKYYANAKVLLNDHWDGMREMGFIANRIFDALASKAALLTDDVEGLESILPNFFGIYTDDESLVNLIHNYLNGNGISEALKNQLYHEVIKNHTFEKRTQQITSDIEMLLAHKHTY